MLRAPFAQRLFGLVGASELTAPQRVTLDVADFGHVFDSDPLGVVAAAREQASMIKHGGDPLLFEGVTSGLRDPGSRDVNGVLVIPSDRLAVIDAAIDSNGFDCDTPSFGDPLPDVGDCL